jgi:hypothetical protein
MTSTTPSAQTGAENAQIFFMQNLNNFMKPLNEINYSKYGSKCRQLLGEDAPIKVCPAPLAKTAPIQPPPTPEPAEPTAKVGPLIIRELTGVSSVFVFQSNAEARIFAKVMNTPKIGVLSTREADIRKLLPDSCELYLWAGQHDQTNQNWLEAIKLNVCRRLKIIRPEQGFDFLSLLKKGASQEEICTRITNFCKGAVYEEEAPQPVRESRSPQPDSFVSQDENDAPEPNLPPARSTQLEIPNKSQELELTRATEGTHPTPSDEVDGLKETRNGDQLPRRRQKGAKTQAPPPFSDNAEKGLISCLLQAPGRVFPKVEARWFFNPAYVILYDAISAWSEPEQAVNFIWLIDQLDAHHQLHEVGGRENVSSLYDFVPSPDPFTYYIASVRDCFVRREAMRILTEQTERFADRVNDPHEVLKRSIEDLERVSGLNGAGQKSFIEILSPLEIKQYKPPKDMILIGDNHFVRGDVTIIGGPPGVGKSRALVAVAQSGATGKDWMGYVVKNQFRTLLIQNENGLLRLQRELADIDEPELEQCLRISEPPPFGMCFWRREFRDQLRRIYETFGPQLVGLDPWNAMALDDKAKDYLETFEVVREVFSPGDHGPCLVIVAHTRKPMPGERANGRALLNLLAGSYVLTSVPRTVFILQHASDSVTENKVVVTCSKNNNGQLGRGVWIRRNGLFDEVKNFDWEEWDSGEKAGPTNRLFTPQRVAEILTDFSKGLPKHKLVKELKDLGASVPTAYRSIDDAKKAGTIKFQKGSDSYVPVEED